MFLLIGLIATTYGVALLLPGVSLIRHSPHYRDLRHLMLIQDMSYPGDSTPTISSEQYLFWKHRNQDTFDDFAFYRVTREYLSVSGKTQAAGIAVASSNLFDLLGLEMRLSAPLPQAPPDLPRLVLSDSTWKSAFAADPHIAGRTVQLGSHTAVVAGVAPQGAWQLPGNVDGWLLVPDGQIASGAEGFVVAHLKPTPEHRQWAETWRLYARNPDGDIGAFTCSSLIDRDHGPIYYFMFSVFLACLALPATTSLPLGEYRVTSQKLSWSTRLRRWAFLASKLALLLPIVYLASLDLAHLRAGLAPLSATNIQVVSSFLICLFGLRWVLRDQRQRCPVCLKRLTHPARVGQPSRNFLAWNGTELMCVAGHGLLHIPEMRTSWFDNQRWLYLDPSWDVLFADPAAASATYF
jgi:hypothetical protein